MVRKERKVKKKKTVEPEQEEISPADKMFQASFYRITTLMNENDRRIENTMDERKLERLNEIKHRLEIIKSNLGFGYEKYWDNPDWGIYFIGQVKIIMDIWFNQSIQYDRGALQ